MQFTYQANWVEWGLELDTEKIGLISGPENDLMLADDLLNKYRWTSPISVAKYSTMVLQTYPV